MYEFEVFDNPRPGRHFMIESVTHEFTCNCPMTGQPDFATLRFRTVPGEKCVELKSLKLFLWSFRNEGHFHEDVTNRILDQIVAAIDPVFLEVRGEFNVRGGISTVITVRHGELPATLADIERSENIF
ncbi:MAG: NADPH-dependent 7-cyano-7-deazaguanine reductase QueF [Planctomycetes bacterium]|nr:NADPH-dependent 7-cyano-7-deazaguanine reductase QueF [Planctomycetota bacterium]